MIGARHFRGGHEADPQQVVRAVDALLRERRHVRAGGRCGGTRDAEDFRASAPDDGFRRDRRRVETVDLSRDGVGERRRVPLYGTCMMFTPVAFFRSSSATCGLLLMPDEPHVAFPGFAFA